jgi:two-component system, NarL family, sensor kinase
MSNNIGFLVILGVAVMLMLMVGVLLAVFFSQRKKNQHRIAMEKLREQQQNQLIAAAVQSEETERHRIAETLHDEVGAILSSAKLHLLGIKPTGLDEKDLKLHEKGSGLLNEVIKKVRGISHNLHSHILKEFGFNEAIRDFLAQVTSGSVIDASTELDDTYMTEDPDNDISLYRTVQELVNNILKYANARELVISSVLKDKELELTIFHNGEGLTQQQFDELSFQKEGLGLKNIRNRIILLKGSIHFTHDNDGYRINIKVPVSKLVNHADN